MGWIKLHILVLAYFLYIPEWCILANRLDKIIKSNITLEDNITVRVRLKHNESNITNYKSIIVFNYNEDYIEVKN